MPIYEYECTQCNTQLEYYANIDYKETPICSACGHVMNKIISKSSFKLSGPGWYKDGYSSPSKETITKGNDDV